MPGNFQCNLLPKQQPETSAPLVTGTSRTNHSNLYAPPESQERISSNPTVRLNYALRQIKISTLTRFNRAQMILVKITSLFTIKMQGNWVVHFSFEDKFTDFGERSHNILRLI